LHFTQTGMKGEKGGKESPLSQLKGGGKRKEKGKKTRFTLFSGHHSTLRGLPRLLFLPHKRKRGKTILFFKFKFHGGEKRRGGGTSMDSGGGKKTGPPLYSEKSLFLFSLPNRGEKKEALPPLP